MRRRSDTIQADSLEEFFEASIANGPDFFPSSQSSFIESPYCFLPSNSTTFDFPPPKSSLLFPEEPNHPRMKPAPIEEEFDQEYCPTPSTDSGSMNSIVQNDSYFSSPNNARSSGYKVKLPVQEEPLHKVMIIGGMGTGRHTMINSLFGEEGLNEKKEEPKLRNSLDLVIKSKKDNERVERFKFWIRDPTCQRFDPLIKVYYKSIDFYVFLYNVHDRKSFECAGKAIQEVLREVSVSRFRGLLIGTGLGEFKERREVSAEEGEEVCEQYQMEGFMEIEDFYSDVDDLQSSFMKFIGC